LRIKNSIAKQSCGSAMLTAPSLWFDFAHHPE